MDNMLGMKELYDIRISATSPIIIAGREIAVGEPIAVFDSIQVSVIQAETKFKEASGGYKNTPRVMWEDTKQVGFSFTQGVFSKLHLALLGNYSFENNQTATIPMTESLLTDSASKVVLKYTPIVEKLFIYNTAGTKLTNYIVNDKTIIFDKYKNEEVIVVYSFSQSGASIITIGQNLIDGFLELSAKTRLRDDKTGANATGIFKIPKFKLVSDLSIRLGSTVSPVTGQFQGVGFLTGERGKEKVMEFILLQNDIDSDI